MAAHVSSADDSMARTVNLAFWKGGGRHNLTARRMNISWTNDNSAKAETPKQLQPRNHFIPPPSMWSSTYSSRRSHEQSGETKQSRSSSPGESQESHRRTSSEATPRPTPANPRFLSASTDQDVSKSFMSTTPAEVFTSSSKRIGGFLAEKLSSSLSGTGSSHRNQSQLHVPNNHTRGDSSASTMTSLSLSPVPMASSTSINSTKTHTSPSKASYGRTYDSKVVTREMHRLGNFSQLSGALAPQLSTAPSASSLSLPTPGSASQVSLTSTATADPWETLHVYVLPLFNGEAFKIPIEDLNGLVKRHIQTVVSSSPSRALVKLEGDASELIANGMLTLNSKLIDIDEEKLLARIVETWGFFWDQILPYLEGVLLPLQTEPLLSTLSRPKPVHRGTSPSRSGQTSSSQLSTGTPSIDVRTLALRSFRDKVVYPLFPRLFARLNVPGRHDVFEDKAGYQQPRLQQMLLVLSAQSRRRPVTLSLTAPAPQPTPGEAAITDLLLLVRSPHPLSINRTQAFTLKPSGTHSRTPSFLSGGKPRDRRGRIGKRHGALSPGQLHFSEEDLGDDTPRVGMSVAASYMQESDREKDRELLESLRKSPDDADSGGVRASMGGWGLGDCDFTIDDSLHTTIDEEEEETEMDQAQADLEKFMATMHPLPSPNEPKRRPQ